MPRRAVRKRFREAFERDQVFVTSSFARRFVREPTTEIPFEGDLSRGLLARTLAKVIPPTQDRSLATFFGVSLRAMSYRLLEFRLVLD